jgi:hypothetical protein
MMKSLNSNSGYAISLRLSVLCFTTVLVSQVLSDIAHHNIQIFQAPMYENEDEETIAENEEIAVSESHAYSQPEQAESLGVIGQDSVCCGGF